MSILNTAVLNMVPKKIATLNLNHRCGRWGFPTLFAKKFVYHGQRVHDVHFATALRYAEAMWNKLLSKNKRPPAVRYPFCKMILLNILHQNDSQQKDVFHPDSPMNQNQLHCKMVFCRVDIRSSFSFFHRGPLREHIKPTPQWISSTWKHF